MLTSPRDIPESQVRAWRLTVAILPMRPDASRTQAQHPALCCRRSPRYAPSKHTDLSRPCERERDPRGLVNALGEVLRLGVSLRRCSCIMAFLPSCCTCRTLCSDTDSLRGAAPPHSTTCLKILTDPRHSRTQERSVQPGQGRRPQLHFAAITAIRGVPLRLELLYHRRQVCHRLPPCMQLTLPAHSS